MPVKAGVDFNTNQWLGVFCQGRSAKMAELACPTIPASFELSQYESLTCSVFWQQAWLMR
jgi:hypothetical protein